MKLNLNCSKELASSEIAENAERSSKSYTTEKQIFSSSLYV